MSKIKFQPARGLEESLLLNPYTEGMIYFATDSGRIFIDADGVNKIPLGGGGVSILYGDDTNVKQDLVNQTYAFHIDALPEGTNPKIGDLIINSDGMFYKIQEIKPEDGELICVLIAVSGTGGGGGGSSPGGSTSAMSIEVLKTPPVQTIYGQPYEIEVKVTSTEDDLVTIYYQIVNEVTSESKTIPKSVTSGAVHKFDIGSELYSGSNLVIIYGVGANGGETGRKRYSGRVAIEMLLNKSTAFNPLAVSYGALTFTCTPVGRNLTKKLTIQVDPEANGYKIEKEVTSSQQDVSVEIPVQSHGMHTIKAVLSYGEGTTYVETAPLIYEVAWIDAEATEPVIWLDNYPTEIVDHDKLILQYKVFNPANPAKAETRLYLNQEELPTSPVTASYVTGQWTWEKWQITNYEIGTNVMTLSCGKTSRSITVKVSEDTTRDLNIIPTGLYLNLESKGRSNKENQSIRNKWEYTNTSNETTSVTFNNFNWYNNGWILDENDDTCLRISNGASIRVPMNLLETSNLETGLTFEFQFKLRNVQSYATLITTTSEEVNGEVIITKTANTEEGVFGKYFNNNIGLCLGTQEAFFKTKNNNIVNGRYKENEIVNVSFVLEKLDQYTTTPLLYVYINGIMSGIITYTSQDSFQAKQGYFEFNSEYCDIDLYKMRVYKAALTSANVVHNYIADYADAQLYDMNQLLDNNSALPMIDFEKMLEYNLNNPDNPIMPYAVLEVHGDTTDERLPYVKDGKKRLDVDFVNPALDRAFEKGEITGAQYLTGCPSYHAENAEFDVQGTSSQGYPRRNYKGKFKSKDDAPVVWTYTNGPLKGQSLQSKINYEGKDYKYYYMDNKDAAESTFTWKADYMESSGTHNTGFTSFVKTLYSKHPLVDYNKDYVTGDHRTTIYGFPMLVFQKHKDGTYEFIGKYNYNLDKGCNNVIDFKNGDAQPYVVGNPFVPEKYQTYVDDEGVTQTATYEMIAECWEFGNNQGTRCSFKKGDFGELNDKGFLSVTDDLEYRYSYYEDDIDDALELKENYPTTADANILLREKYRNLERLFDWIMSTDSAKATNLPLEAPVTYGTITYDIDSSAYRLAKFTYEFTQHFDPEYCYIYFIMTELILGYDSRGKNMMLGSWGPKSATGDYIWYPMFYDVDTQLGVNNSGVPTWEYDTNATRDKQFSTADSVLWNNLWTCFSNPIKTKYIELRKELLTIEKLNGFYDFDPAISKSYAMMGGRPMVAYNIDEYYKYISPAFEGFIDTTGNKAYTKTFFYCLQGTRELQRELFLRNRFNYLDSEWLAGSYSKEAVLMQFKARYDSNDAINTSDKFINEAPDYINPDYVKPDTMTDKDLEDLRKNYQSFIDNGGIIQDWKTSPLDSEASMTITPYLKQYVGLWYDETPTATVAFDGENPITIEPFESVQNSVMNTPMFSQQLMYIGGLEYVSSLGDLSTKYFDELKIEPAIRLKELILGNENPGYKNTRLNNSNFFLDAGAKTAKGEVNPQAKPLLETLVLTNLSAFDAEMDISGSEKLKSCRALGTNLTGMTFADGVQLETLYLPRTISYLKLTEPVSLHGLLDTVPTPDAEGKFPTGLYLQGLTDITVDDNSTTLLTSIDIIGGKELYYDSYKIVDKVVKIKEKMQAQTNLDTKYDPSLKINLENLQWSPYRQVEVGETVVVNAVYYKLLDNYTFERYTPEKPEEWTALTLNGKIYEYTESLLTENANLITDLSLLDKFILSYESAENYFQSTNEIAGKNTIPYMSGNIFINNTDQNPLSEYELKNKYKDIYFPDLNIFTNYVEPAYTAKFIQLDGDKEIEWDVHKYDPATTTHPTISSKENPEKLHYDFIGWSRKKNGTVDDVMKAEDFEKLSYSASNTVYTFYAVFTIHSYEVKIKNYNNSLTDENDYDHIMYIPSGQSLYDPPAYLPYKPSTDLDDDKVYKFVGYSSEADGSNIVNLSDYLAVKNYTFYAVYKEVSVYENLIDNKYFTFTEYSYVETVHGDSAYNLDGYKLTPAPDVVLKGKITIPAKYNNLPVVAIGEFYNQEVTHIFFEPGSEIREISSFTFTHGDKTSVSCTTLKYFDFVDSIRVIGQGAFRGIPLEMSTCILPEHLYLLDARAFLGAFKSATPITIIIGSELKVMNYYAIANNYNIPSAQNKIIIGSAEKKSQLDLNKTTFTTESNGYRRIYSTYYTVEFYTDLYHDITDQIYFLNNPYSIAQCLDSQNGGSGLQLIS